MKNLAALFTATISAKMDECCPAVQRAIDEIAKDGWHGDRAYMLECLSRFTDADLFNDIMNGWAKKQLKRATGRSREEWLGGQTYIDATAGWRNAGRTVRF